MGLYGKYCVTFQEYCEYNQFEGSWSNGIERFHTMKQTEEYMGSIKNNDNYRDVEGPWIHKDVVYAD